MSDLAAAQAQWHDWIEEACAALGVDAALVDVGAIHGLTKRIAHEYDRPMAPVGAFILGLALGGREGADVAPLRAVLESTLHGRAREAS